MLLACRLPLPSCSSFFLPLAVFVSCFLVALCAACREEEEGEGKEAGSEEAKEKCIAVPGTGGGEDRNVLRSEVKVIFMVPYQ